MAVDVPWKPLGPKSSEDLQARFDATYREAFGRNVGGIASGEVVSWSLSVSGPRYPDTSRQNQLFPPSAKGAFQDRERKHRPVFDARQSGFKPVPVADRSSLGPGVTVAGPAIIVEPQTSVVVSEEFDAQVLATNDIELRLRAPADVGKDQ